MSIKESAMEPVNQKPTLWQVIKSMLAAMFGVQSDQVYRRDFEKGNPWAYIVVGIVITVVFVLTLVLVVKWVLAGVKS